jgi:hypothetical protein
MRTKEFDMKTFLILVASLVLNQTVFAEGDPNLAMPEAGASEAGSVATAAVAVGGQPAVCKTCMTAGQANLGNNIGVLNSVNASSSGSSGPSSPVKTGN